MIIGAHSIIYSTHPDADRAFLRDILGMPSVDVGGGWLIFGLPPSEVAVHPGDDNDVHEFYLLVDDVQAFIAEMNKRNIICGPLHNQPWGVLTQVLLPGGGKLGVYQPRHARPKPMAERRLAKKSARKPAKRAAQRTPARKPAKRAKKR